MASAVNDTTLSASPSPLAANTRLFSEALGTSSELTNSTSPLRVFHLPALAPSPGHLSIDNGIAFDAVRGVTNNDVLRAIVSAEVPANRIHSISRVRGQYHVYFKDSSFARLLLTDGLSLAGVALDVFPVGRLPRRVVISNVPPYVPDLYLRQILNHYGKVRGSFVPLRASATDAEFADVLCHRRSVFVDFEDDAAFQRLPASVEVFFGDASHVFLFNEPVKCFSCGQPGHNKNACPTFVIVPDPTASTSMEVEDPPPSSLSLTDATAAGASGGPTKSLKRNALSTAEVSKRLSPVTTMSSPQGDFSVNLKTNEWRDKKGSFTATGPGYSDIRAAFFTPQCDKSQWVQAVTDLDLDKSDVTQFLRQVHISFMVYRNYPPGERAEKLQFYRNLLKSVSIALGVDYRLT